MDPLSQGVLGSVLPQSVVRGNDSKRRVTFAGVAGFLGGMAADLDVLIRSGRDPLLFLEYHRQFTHSLIFIPVGGALVALALWPFFRKRLGFATLAADTILGYATHALLDACTTYGTQLFWPFSNHRVAWNNVSIIDPLFTFPLLAAVLLAIRRGKAAWARAGLVYAVAYLLLGCVQRERAEAVGRRLAETRGHRPVRLEAKPTFANLILWKIVYETADRYYVDAVRVGSGERIFEGSSAPKLDVARDFPGLPPESAQARDIERFRWFSNGYVTVHPGRPEVIADIRYSLVPNELEPLWGIVIDPARPEEHVRYETFRGSIGEKRAAFWRMLTSEAP